MVAGNVTFPIYNSDGTSFNGLELKKSVYESVVMSLGDKITGDVYYPNNSLVVTMKEYITYNGVKYVLVNPPTIVREGMVSDNGELKGMTKYSFTFYHPMYMLGNFPLCDVAVSSDQQRYLSENKTFFWIGNLTDFVAKLNKNLENTEWYCVVNDSVSQADRQRLSDVMSFDKNTIADALKTGYETWDVPYIISIIPSTDPLYQQGKRFLIQYGLPSTEILVENAQHELVPFVFHFGQGVGLKNNSRTPRNNKIVTRIAGYGSEDNIQYGYPQIPYEGGDCQYPLYYGIVGGQRVQLIKHPFTRTHLMPSIYRETVNKKVNPMATGYDPTIELKDYYDADNTYENPIKPLESSYEIHEFEKIKPELGQRSIVGVSAYSDKDLDSISLSSFISLLSEYYTESEYLKEKEELEKIINTIGTMSSNSGSVNTRAYYCDWSFTKDERYAYVKFESSALNFEYTVLMVSQSQDVEWDDTMDDDGNYVQSYFRITIPQLSFDLYASAAITQEMTINMRSGACLGCSFPVMVDWDDYKLNFYDADGNFAPNGSQRNYDKYPDSSQGQITLILQKETSTFGTLMPNIYQKPHAGDEFVILGISLPTSYITSAEARLDAEMKQYMRDNNVYYYDYPLKFDEHFLTTHAGILSQMDNNVIVRFDYAGTEHALYIKQVSVKYENKPLPTYDITLTDNIEVVLNQIGQVVDEVRRLHDNLGGVEIQPSNNYLRKDIDDTAYGMIRLIKGLQVGNRFVTGLLGEGGVFRKEEDGTTYLECDKMYVRMKAYFDTVEVRHYMHSAGNRVASNAGINCSRVEYIDSNGDVTQDVTEATLFRCYFRANDDGREVRNDFIVGDLAFCRETNVNTDSVDQHGYWRAVVGRNANGVLTDDGEGWIDLSVSDCQEGSGIPIAQDDIVQLGNKTDTTRQGAIIEFVSGADAPSYQIYQGINTYSLNGKNYIGLGYSSQNARAYLNVYGDAYIGDPNESSYIRYNAGTRNLEIKAKISAQSTIDGETLAQFIAENTWTEEQIDALITAETDPLSDAIEDIKRQVDGNIATWFYDGEPTLQNLPASQWTTADDKNEHLGDLYYDNLTGYGYRFKYDDLNRQWSWMRITDVDVTKALADAAKAQDTADHKRRVFVVQPTPPYDAGDLWVNATYPSGNTETNEAQSKYYNDVLRCKTSKASGTTFAIADWSLASKYTDDSALYTFINGDYATFVTDITNQVDVKAETWYQSTDPAASWNTQELKQAHKGDIWHNTASSTVSGVEAGRDAIWSGTEWEMSDVPQEVYDKIDGKADIFVSKPTTYNKFDMWIIESSTSTCPDADIPSGCKRGDIVIAKNKRTNSYKKADWQKKDRYTDDSALNAFKADQYVTQLTNGTITTNIANAQSAASAAQQAADNAQADADAAATAAANAQTSATNANNRLDGWADDGKISPTEKTSLKLEWENVKKEYTQICNDADKYGVSKTAFTSAYTSANSAFQKYTAATPENITIGTDYANIAAYYAARQTILDAITTAAKKVATDAQAKADSAYALAGSAEAAAQAAEAHAATLDYVKTALKQDTVIEGGLVLSTLIALRDGSNHIWSGISGTYQTAETGTGYKGHGIAAWLGGAMVDKEVTTTATDYAKSLFRFDGSGYVASGNLSWDKNGNVTIQGYSINATTLQVGGSAVATQAALADYVTLATTQTISGHKVFEDYIDIDRTVYGSLPLGTQVSILRARSKNAETGTYDYNTIISTFGSGETSTTVNNFPIRIGSTSGVTWVNAGESGKTLSSVYTDMCNTENLLLTSDGIIEFFSGLSNNSSNYESRKILTINSSGLVIPSGKTLTIGDAVLSWDSTNQGIKITKGLYSQTFISALGEGSGGSGGGGIDMTTVWTALGNATTEQINATHLANALSGYNPTSNFKTINGNSIIGTGNIEVGAAGDYLPLTGGTITSSTSGPPLQINTTYSYADSYITFKYNGVSKAYFGYEHNLHTHMQSASGSHPTIGIRDDGTPYYSPNNGSTVYALYHAGNLPAYPTKDSWNYDDRYLKLSGGTLSGTDNYTLTINSTHATETSIVIQRKGTNKGWIGYSDVEGVYIFNSARQGYLAYKDDGTLTFESYTIIHSGNILSQSVAHATKANGLVDGNSTMTSAYNKSGLTTTSWFAAWNGYELRAISPTATKNTLGLDNVNNTADSDKTVKNSHYLLSLNGDTWHDTQYRIYAQWDDSTHVRLKTTDATYDVRVSASDKLVTERTIWGQNFDGTGNVSGAISDATNLFVINDNSSSAYDAMVYFRNYSNADWAVKIDCSTYHYGLYIKANNDALSVDGKTSLLGATSLSSTLSVTGATTLSSTLGVSGAATLSSTLNVTDNTTLSGTLSVSKATTLSSTLVVSGNAKFSKYTGFGYSADTSYRVKVNGVVYASTGVYSGGYVTALSDIRHKDVRGDVNLSVSEVANAPSVKFLWKDRRQEGMQVGSIAQYWKKVMPEAVVENADGELTMSYGVIAMLSAISIARKVQKHDERIKELEGECKRLRAELSMYKHS